MLTLSENGLLAPGIHACLPADLFALFVKPFAGSYRKHLFNEWQIYNAKLKSFVGNQTLTQWIDGSFITNKPNPGDIDLVTFVSFDFYEQHVDQLIDDYSTFSLYDSGLDAYICPVYPSSHPNFAHYLDRRQYWQKLFGSQKDNVGQKGFLEIIL